MQRARRPGHPAAAGPPPPPSRGGSAVLVGDAAADVGGEVRGPRTSVPRALVLGTAVVMVLYVALAMVYLRALGPTGMAASPAVGDAAAGREWSAPEWPSTSII